jgi:N-methylhydantoinase A/oxoprolinase/acetone carboxylase beta subunit
LASWPAGDEDASRAIKETRPVYFGAWLETPIYDGSKLLAGNQFQGPAIIEEVTTTIVVFPNDRAEVDRLGNVVIHVNAKGV